MISQKMRALGQALSVGLLTTALCAPAALAQGKGGPQCPFSAKDIDNWYKSAGFDTKDTTAGKGGWDCQDDGVQASLSQWSNVADVMVFNNETVPTLTMNKSILVYVNSAGENDLNWQYTVDVFGDGFAVNMNEEPLISIEQADACMAEMRNSMAWKRWVCANE